MRAVGSYVNWVCMANREAGTTSAKTLDLTALMTVSYYFNRRLIFSQ